MSGQMELVKDAQRLASQYPYHVATVVASIGIAVFVSILFRRPKRHVGKFGAKSTAKEVVDGCGEGEYLKGKTAIVTGGNSGIGLELCKALLSKGARVILCSRSVAAGEKAVKEEIEQLGQGGYVAPSGNCVVKELDLNSLRSVKAFAEDFLAHESRLDLLVLNAGIMALPKLEVTEAGFERQIGVNHFGHAYLESLLRPLMRQQDSPSRVVVLSSTAHSFGEIDLKDLHYKHGRKYTGWNAYGQSKLANLLFAKVLAEKLKGSKVTAVSVHPGVIQTNLWRSTKIASGLLSWVVGLFVMDKTIPQGAATSAWACVAPEVLEDSFRGSYLVDCWKETPAECGQDLSGKVGEDLWNVTKDQLDKAVRSL